MRKPNQVQIGVLLYFRLVNMLDVTKGEEEHVWKIVKKTRRSFLYEHPDTGCQDFNTLLYDKNIQENINSLEKELKLNTSLTPDKNVSFKTFKTAEHLHCVSSIKVNTSECLQQCSGVMVTSKTENRLLSVVRDAVQKNKLKSLKVAK